MSDVYADEPDDLDDAEVACCDCDCEGDGGISGGCLCAPCSCGYCACCCDCPDSYPSDPSERCSSTCDGPGPDFADQGPDRESAVAIPCPKCGRMPEGNHTPGAAAPPTRED